MASVITIKTTDGQPVSFLDDIIGQGAMKDVYLSPDRSYVVCFFRDPQPPAAKERLQTITGLYREKIFNQTGGDYWKNLFCWPTAMVEWNGKLGIVAPTYPKHFFFEFGSIDNDKLGIKGKEKEGKWFASASNRARFLDVREKGHWLNHIRICLLISRGVKRLHAAGLAHSDLSYKNVLVDPMGGNAAIIDIDTLVVPGKFPPEVIGTPDFIAPEVVKTTHLSRTDPARVLPSIFTDRHALAVLIYMYLLYRHPLRGGKVHDMDPAKDESLGMGERALFVEHPSDASNRVNVSSLKTHALPWGDPSKIPYSVTGPYLSALFKKAFVDGLHDPAKRPTADEWEDALIRTVDLVQPCGNPDCGQKWYVFDNSMQPKCPFCGTVYKGKLPVLNLYSSRGGTAFRPDNHRLMVYSNQSLFLWHANRNIVPNERLAADQRKRVGYFVLHQGVWYLVNEGLRDLTDATTKTPIPPGNKVELKDGLQLLLSKEDGGRLVVVQMVSGA